MNLLIASEFVPKPVAVRVEDALTVAEVIDRVLAEAGLFGIEVARERCYLATILNGVQQPLARYERDGARPITDFVRHSTALRLVEETVSRVRVA